MCNIAYILAVSIIVLAVCVQASIMQSSTIAMSTSRNEHGGVNGPVGFQSSSLMITYMKPSSRFVGDVHPHGPTSDVNIYDVPENVIVSV